ncbi:MAG TPA: alpha/beta fold hydrolase [Candidatus Saccharimonadales bacterium]|nr:alpha/beta fold hydrolase [Candidatus Saccharimonadales bacterium]
MTTNTEEVTILSDSRKLYGKLWLAGDDEPIIMLLPGVGFHTFEYEALATQLVKRGFNCLAFDYRGHGRSEGKRGVWRLQDLTDDTRCAVDYAAARFKGEIGIFGNSLGAMVGANAAAQDERITALVISTCPTKVASFMFNPLRKFLFFLAKLVPAIIPLRISLNHFYSYRQLIDDQKLVATITADALVTDARRLSVTAYRALLDEWDGADAISKVHIPLLILQGKNDHFQPPEEANKLYAAANEPKELKFIETGHLPHLENPEFTAGILAKWFHRLVG